MRQVTDEEVATFWRDGVVCLRGVMPLDWIELVARSIEPVVWRAAAATRAGP